MPTETTRFQDAAEAGERLLRRLDGLKKPVRAGGFCLHAILCLIEVAEAANKVEKEEPFKLSRDQMEVAVVCQRLIGKIAAASDAFLDLAAGSLDECSEARPSLISADHLSHERLRELRMDVGKAKKGADTFWEVAAGLAGYKISPTTCKLTPPDAKTPSKNVDVTYERVIGTYGVECKCLEQSWPSLSGTVMKHVDKFEKHPVDRGLFAVNVSRLLIGETIPPDAPDPGKAVSKLIDDRFQYLVTSGKWGQEAIECFEVPARPWLLLYGEVSQLLPSEHGLMLATVAGETLLPPLNPHPGDERLAREFTESLKRL